MGYFNQPAASWLANVGKSFRWTLRALRLYALWFIREPLLMFCKCLIYTYIYIQIYTYIWHLCVPCQFLHRHRNPLFYLTNDRLIYFCDYLIYQWIDWSQSNEVFYQSYCEHVPFDTVNLFFLREQLYIYIFTGAGSASHCFSFCHEQLQK